MRVLLTSLAAVVAVALFPASPASAELNSGFSAGDLTLFVNSDGEDDAIAITCEADTARVNGADLSPPVPCDAPLTITLSGGGGGADVLDVTGVDATEWAALLFTTLDGGEGPDVLRDALVANLELFGTLRGDAGDDLIVPGVAALIDAGSGDDRIEGLGTQGAKPDGGEGTDELAIDLTPVSPSNWTVTPRDHGLALGLTGDDPTLVEWSSIERFDALLNDGDQTLDASGFSGRVRAEGLGGADTLIGGPLADALDGGSGDDLLEGGGGEDALGGGGDNDALDGGGGADQYAGGDGADLIRARDDLADGGDCGPGADTLIADAIDVLTACETIELPPGPPGPRLPDPPAPDPPTPPVPLPDPPSTPPPPPNPAAVKPGWRVDGKRTAITRMRIANVAVGTVVELRCSGTKCPFRSKRTGKARKGVVDGLALLGKRANRQLRVGQTLEVRLTAPGHLGKVLRYKVRKGKQPKLTTLCLPVGKTKPQPRC